MWLASVTAPQPCPPFLLKQAEREIVFEDQYGHHVAVPAEEVYSHNAPVPIPVDPPAVGGPQDRSG